MIEQTVQDLTTIIGQAGMSRAGRGTGDDLPSPPAADATAAEATAGARQGAV